MKKRLMITFAVLFMAIVPAKSQIFMLSEEEFNSNRAEGAGPFGVMVATQDVPYDQYVPLGGGWLLLTGLGGAYLLKKRKKRQ